MEDIQRKSGSPPDTGFPSIEPEYIQSLIESLQADIDYSLEYSQFSAEAEHVQQNFFTGSTRHASDFCEPLLTQESTIPTSSGGYSSDEPHLYQYDVDSTPLKESCEDLSAPKVDLQCIGVAHEICFDGLPRRPPHISHGEGFSLTLAQDGFAGECTGDIIIVPDTMPAAALVTATGRTSGRVSSADLSDLGRSPSLGTQLGSNLPVAQPMVRGRSGNLSREARKKAADMRDARACDRCRIRRISVSTINCEFIPGGTQYRLDCIGSVTKTGLVSGVQSILQISPSFVNVTD